MNRDKLPHILEKLEDIYMDIDLKELCPCYNGKYFCEGNEKDCSVRIWGECKRKAYTNHVEGVSYHLREMMHIIQKHRGFREERKNGE